ncbi:MAG: TetR/AcrR family transcriptional regulator [Chloroflexi bacterium]|nr:TetR/AcrR family transcriptional regulator [Chloroflexota bacterium]
MNDSRLGSKQNGIRNITKDALGEAPGRLARRKARTREAILAAASGLFHTRGFEETSIQQIAEAADTGVGTVYGYFASKDEVLREVLRRHSDEAVQRYRAAVTPETPSIDRICLALEAVAHYIRDHRSIELAAFQTASHELRLEHEPDAWLLNAFAAMIQAGIERGELRAVPVETTARTLIGACTMAMLGMGMWRGRDEDPATLAELLTITRRLLVTE